MVFLREEIRKYKKEFDPLFLSYIPKEPLTLWRPVIYHFKTGGKRWRPFLIRTIGKIYKIPQSACELLEVIVELTHNWTLIHDDIEDGDISRRGKETLWKKFGIDYGINCGDAMFALSFRLLEKGEKIWGRENTLFLLETLSKTLLNLAEGQNLEFDFRKMKKNIRFKDYMKMIAKKTAMLPKFGVLGIAKIGDVPAKDREALGYFCDNIFPAFQIKDDILNLIGRKEYGKERGGDIKEGKRTIPLWHLLENVSRKDRKEILEIVLKDREKTTREEVKYVIGLMKKKGSIEFALSVIENLVKNSKKAVVRLPKRPEKKILEELSDWLAKERTY